MPSSLQSVFIDAAQPPVVLSASRRTDPAACYPCPFIAKQQKHLPERVHTLAAWTNNPHTMLTRQALRSALQRIIGI